MASLFDRVNQSSELNRQRREAAGDGRLSRVAAEATQRLAAYWETMTAPGAALNLAAAPRHTPNAPIDVSLGRGVSLERFQNSTNHPRRLEGAGVRSARQSPGPCSRTYPRTDSGRRGHDGSVAGGFSLSDSLLSRRRDGHTSRARSGRGHATGENCSSASRRRAQAPEEACPAGVWMPGVWPPQFALNPCDTSVIFQPLDRAEQARVLARQDAAAQTIQKAARSSQSRASAQAAATRDAHAATTIQPGVRRRLSRSTELQQTPPLSVTDTTEAWTQTFRPMRVPPSRHAAAAMIQRIFRTKRQQPQISSSIQIPLTTPSASSKRSPPRCRIVSLSCQSPGFRPSSARCSTAPHPSPQVVTPEHKRSNACPHTCSQPNSSRSSRPPSEARARSTATRSSTPPHPSPRVGTLKHTQSATSQHSCSQPNLSRSSRPPNETRATSTATASSKAKEAASTKVKVAASSKPSEAGSLKPSEAASSNAASSKAKEASSSSEAEPQSIAAMRIQGTFRRQRSRKQSFSEDLLVNQTSCARGGGDARPPLEGRCCASVAAGRSTRAMASPKVTPSKGDRGDRSCSVQTTPAYAKRDRKRPQKSTPSNLSSPRSDSVLSSAASHRLSQSDERSHAALQEASFARMAGQHAKAALAVQDALESARNRERQTARIGTPTTKLRAHSDRVERSAVRAREPLRTERLKEQAAPVRSSPQTPLALPRTPSRAAQTSRRCGAVNAKGGHPEGAPALNNLDARSPDQVERCGEADKGGWSAIDWLRSLWGSPEKSCNSNKSNVEGSRQPLGAEEGMASPAILRAVDSTVRRARAAVPTLEEAHVGGVPYLPPSARLQFVTSSAAAKMRGAQELKASLAQQQAQHQSLLAPNQVKGARLARSSQRFERCSPQWVTRLASTSSPSRGIGAAYREALDGSTSSEYSTRNFAPATEAQLRLYSDSGKGGVLAHKALINEERSQLIQDQLAEQLRPPVKAFATEEVAKILGRLDVELLPLVAQGFEMEQGESLNKAIARLSHSDARTLMLGLLSVPPNGPVDLNAAMSAARRVYEVGETQDCKKISRLCSQVLSSASPPQIAAMCDAFMVVSITPSFPVGQTLESYIGKRLKGPMFSVMGNLVVAVASTAKASRRIQRYASNRQLQVTSEESDDEHSHWINSAAEASHFASGQTTSSIYIGDADFAMMSTAAPLSDYLLQIVRVEHVSDSPRSPMCIHSSQVRGSFQNEEETLGAKHAAAEVVQGAYRCFLERTSRLREIAPAKRIGTIESGQQAQQAQDEEARKSRAVSVIQARARGKLTRDRTRTLRLITQHAAPMQVYGQQHHAHGDRLTRSDSFVGGPCTEPNCCASFMASKRSLLSSYPSSRQSGRMCGHEHDRLDRAADRNSPRAERRAADPLRLEQLALPRASSRVFSGELDPDVAAAARRAQLKSILGDEVVKDVRASQHPKDYAEKVPQLRQTASRTSMRAMSDRRRPSLAAHKRINVYQPGSTYLHVPASHVDRAASQGHAPDMSAPNQDEFDKLLMRDPRCWGFHDIVVQHE